MPANDFLVFGGGGSANVMSQADWAALAQRSTGFQAGVAQSPQLNKAWRQSSIMAAVLAQFISDRTGQDVLDDGTTATILTNLKASAAAPNGDVTKTFSVAPATLSTHAMQLGQAIGRYLGTRVFTTSGTYTPTAGTNSVVVTVVGGGAGGGSTTTTGAGQVSVSSGGGGGGVARSRLTSGFAGVTMTIGAGGSAGNNGGTTAFGALLSATGGGAGGNGPAASPGYATINGYGGLGSSGNLYNGKGGDGSPGLGISASSFISGAGGASFIGAGAGGLPTQSSGGQNGVAPGSGGGGALAGASTGVLTGGSGVSGIILVDEYA